MDMRKFLVLTGLPVLVILILCSCSSFGGASLIGRWEFGDEKFGSAYEFYTDGTGVVFDSSDPFHPIASDFTYTYDPDTGEIILIAGGDPNQREREYLATFPSRNRMTLEIVGFSKPMAYVRAPLPELPGLARSRLGSLLIGVEFELLSAEELKDDWRDKYSDYQAITRTEYQIIAGEEVVYWVATVQIVGEDTPRLFLLRKGEKQYRWGIIELIKE